MVSDDAHTILGRSPLSHRALGQQHASMSPPAGPGARPVDSDDTWTSETLPMSVRRELLERELKKLGFRRTEAGTPHGSGTVQQQQQPQGPASGHPQADADGGNHSN